MHGQTLISVHICNCYEICMPLLLHENTFIPFSVNHSGALSVMITTPYYTSLHIIGGLRHITVRDDID